MAIVLVPVSFLFNSNLTICHLTRQSSLLFLKNIQHLHYTRSPNRTKEIRQSLLKIKYRNYHFCTTEIWTEFVAMATTKYTPAGVFIWMQQAWQV